MALVLLPTGGLASSFDDTTIKIWNIDKSAIINTLRGHTKTIRALVVVSNMYLVSGSDDKTIRLWDLITYAPMKSWHATESLIWCLVYDSSQNVLASGDNDKLVKVWDSIVSYSLFLP
jgi:WD40 repeat protein